MPSRFEPCGLTQLCAHALRRIACRRACRRTVRHGDRCQRDGAGRRCWHRLSFRPGADRDAGRRRSCARSRCGGSPRCGGGCSATRCRPTSAGAGRRRATRRCIASWSPDERDLIANGDAIETDYGHAAQVRAGHCDPPDRGLAMDIAAAVAAQRELATSLFDQLRRDGLDEPGVSRDPYGPGEQRAHATVDGGRAAARSAHRTRRCGQSLHDVARPRSGREARHRRLASRFGAARRQFRRCRRRGGRVLSRSPRCRRSASRWTATSP